MNKSKNKKNKFGVLITDDKLYYVILDKPPYTIKADAIKKAEKLNKIWNETK